MASTGETTTSLSNQQPLLDEVIGNRDGSTARQAVGDLATQLAGSGAVADELTRIEAQVTSGVVSQASWAALMAIAPSQDGTGGEVSDDDAGTHLAASATGYDGDAVPNAGRYSWSAAWSRWVRIGDTGLAGKMDRSANLADLDDAAVARTSLGLGSAAVADATAFASAAQGVRADTALQQANMDSHKAAADEHPISGVTGLQTALDDKATAAQGAKADTALQPAALTSHKEAADEHPISGVTGLQTALDGKATAALGQEAIGGQRVSPWLQSAWSESTTGAGEGLSPLAIGAPTTNTAIGAGLRIDDSDIPTDPGYVTVAQRETIPIYPGRVLRVTASLIRVTDPADPAGSTVRVSVQHLSGSFSHISQGHGYDAIPMVSDGVRRISFTLSMEPGHDVTVPASARAIRLLHIVYSDAGQIVVGEIEWIDIGEVEAVQTALDAETATRAAADTAQQATLDAITTKTDHLSVTAPTDLDAIRVRVDGLDAAVVLVGSWDPTTGSFPGGGAAQNGQSWIATASATVDGEDFSEGDRIIAIVDDASEAAYENNWLKLDYSDRVSSVAGRTGAVIVNKSDVGLGAVDNTADADKPISTATQAAITAEATTRADADAALQAAIDVEATARADADTELQDAITGEEAARADADTALQQGITNEATARTDADTALQAALSAVDAARAELIDGSDGSVEGVQLLTATRRIIAALLANGTIRTRYLSVEEDDDNGLRIMTALRRVIMDMEGDRLRLGQLVVESDGNAGFAIMTEQRRKLLAFDGTRLTLGGQIEIDASGISIPGLDIPELPETPTPGGLYMGTGLWLTDDRIQYLNPKAVLGTRTDSDQGTVAVASNRGSVTVPPFLAQARDTLIELDPARLGASTTISARAMEGSEREWITLPTTVTAVPVAAAASPNIMVLGDSLSAREVGPNIKDLLEAWGEAPNFVGTLEVPADPGVLIEGRSGWATTDYLSTVLTDDIVAVVDPGDEATYLAGDYDYRRQRQVFINESGEFDFAFFLSRFSLVSPDIVILNLAWNDIIEGRADPSAAIAALAANYPVILDSIRAALPAAHILVWYAPAARDSGADAEWESLGREALKVISAMVRDYRAAGDDHMHLVGTWGCMSLEVGWAMDGAAADATKGTTTSGVNDFVHPLDPNRRTYTEALAAACLALAQGA